MSSKDNIEQSIRKLRFKTSAGTDERILSDAFAALEKLVKQKLSVKQPDLLRAIMKSRITKFAAVAAIIIGVFLVLQHSTGQIEVTSPVFADVLEQIYKARTVTYKQTFYLKGRPSFTTEKMIIESGRMRDELSHGDIMIWDFSSGTQLHLMAEPKRAILTHMVGRARRKRLFNYLDWVSRIHEESGEFACQEEINGQMVDVFVVEVPYEKTTVWVDPETNLPVRVETVHIPNPDKDVVVPEMSLSVSDFGGEEYESSSIIISSGRGSGEGIHKKMTIVMSDFVWDAELDESLFSLEVPEGYSVEEKQLDVSEMGENGLIAAIAFWTEMSEGFFPSAINDLGDPNKVRSMLVAKFDRDGDPREELDEAMKKAHVLLKGLFFAQQQKVDGGWGYAGEGVRLGDADRAVCWWKPKSSDVYRVIYGDLSVGNVSEMPKLQERE